MNARLSDVAWLIGFNLLFFEMWIQNTFGFTYIDELATLVLLAAALLKSIRVERGTTLLGRDAKLAIVCLAMLCCLGFLGNYVYGVQKVTSSIAIDFFTCIKFPIALLSAYIVFKDNDRIYTLVTAESKLLVLVMLACALANLFADFGMGWESYARFGLRASFMFVMGHPTMVVACCVGLTVLLARERERNVIWIALALAVTALTLRSKAFAFIAVAVFLFLTYGKHEKLRFYHVVLALIVAVFVGYDQFVYYFSLDGAARGELLRSSVEVANDLFPLGGGFATYGSAVTANAASYSSLYYEYGLSSVWGLAPGQTSFLSDTFWPTILGQFGWFGLVLYFLGLIYVIRFMYQASSGAKLSVILCFTYLLISSTSESAFFHPMAIYLALCIGVTVSGLKDSHAVEVGGR